MNTEIANLQSEATGLKARASELLAKASYTPEEAIEMTSVQKRMQAIHIAITKSQELETVRSLLQTSVTAQNSWETQVPATNRPASVYDVKGTPPGYTPQPGMINGGYKVNLVNKAFLPEIEPKGATVEAYLSEGYSLETIEKACTPEYKREIIKFMRSGGRDYAGAGDIVRKAFTEGVAAGTSGGGAALVPIQWSELIMTPPMAGMLQDAVRTIPTTALTTRFPRVRTALVGNYPILPASPVTVLWGGETPTNANQTDQGSALIVDQIDINVNEVWAYGLFSISLLEDNAYGLSTLIPDIFQKSLMVATDAAIVAGTGIGQPNGLTEASVLPTTAVVTSTGDKIGYKDLTNLFYGVPQQFRANGSWLMNSNTLGKIASLVDTSGRGIFLPNYGFIGDTPGGGTNWLNGSLLGRPIIISENVPDIGTATYRGLYYADFKSLYYMLDRVSPTIKVNDQPAYKNGAYEFVLRARRGGRIVQPYAGRVLVS